MIEAIRQGLREEGFDVSISQLCRWFDVPRRTFYYKPTKAAPKLREDLTAPVKARKRRLSTVLTLEFDFLKSIVSRCPIEC